MAPAWPGSSKSRYLYRLVPGVCQGTEHSTLLVSGDKHPPDPAVSQVPSALPWKWGVQQDGKCWKGATGPDLHPGPPSADVPGATSEPSNEGTSDTEHGHLGTQRASHIVHVCDAAMTTHPTNGTGGGWTQISPPCDPLLLRCLQKHWGFVCQPFRCY